MVAVRLLLSEETQGAITITFKDGDDEHVAKFRWDQVESCDVRADADYVTSDGEILPRVVLDFYVPESTLRAVVGERWLNPRCSISEVVIEEKSRICDGVVSYRFTEPNVTATFERGHQWAQARRHGQPYAYPTHTVVRFTATSGDVRISLK